MCEVQDYLIEGNYREATMAGVAAVPDCLDVDERMSVMMKKRKRAVGSCLVFEALERGGRDGLRRAGVR